MFGYKTAFQWVPQRTFPKRTIPMDNFITGHFLDRTIPPNGRFPNWTSPNRITPRRGNYHQKTHIIDNDIKRWFVYHCRGFVLILVYGKCFPLLLFLLPLCWNNHFLVSMKSSNDSLEGDLCFLLQVVALLFHKKQLIIFRFECSICLQFSH